MHNVSYGKLTLLQVQFVGKQVSRNLLKGSVRESAKEEDTVQQASLYLVFVQLYCTDLQNCTVLYFQKAMKVFLSHFNVGDSASHPSEWLLHLNEAGVVFLVASRLFCDLEHVSVELLSDFRTILQISC